MTSAEGRTGLRVPVTNEDALAIARRIGSHDDVRHPTGTLSTPYEAGLDDDVAELLRPYMTVTDGPHALFAAELDAAGVHRLRARMPQLWVAPALGEAPPDVLLQALTRWPELRLLAEFELCRDGTWELATTGIGGPVLDLDVQQVTRIDAAVRTCTTDVHDTGDTRWWLYTGGHDRSSCNCPANWGPPSHRPDYAFHPS
jgi:hypothetical protein